MVNNNSLVLFEEGEETFKNDENVEIASHYGICKNQDDSGNYKWFIWLKPTGGDKNDKNKQHSEGCNLLLKRLEILGIDRVDVYKRDGKGRPGSDKKIVVNLKYNRLDIFKVKEVKHSAGSPLVLGSDCFTYQMLLDIKKPIDLTPKNIEKNYGTPKKLARQIYARQGQQKFRKKLLNAYKSKCAITNCNVIAILEAAHIIPFAKCCGYSDKEGQSSNGILLRADIHTLFDLDLIKIEYDNNNDKFILCLDKILKDDSCHKELYEKNGKSIFIPFCNREKEIFKENLQIRRKIYGNYI